MTRQQVHTVRIWRNPRTKKWHHQFLHENGHQLARQSQGVTKRARAIASAVTSYGLGDLVQNTGTEWLSCARLDVVVRIEVTR